MSTSPDKSPEQAPSRRWVRNLLRRWRKSQRGTAAVEFALIAPIMFAMFVGIVELGQAIDCSNRIALVASSAADLITQQTSVQTADLNGIMAITNTILQPYPTAPLKVTAFEVTAGPANNPTAGTVCWSYNYQGGVANYAAGAPYALPAGVAPTGGSAVIVSVSYTYTGPIFTQYVAAGATMTNLFIQTPRLSTYVKYAPQCP